jgi:hypothetical protein
VGMHTVLFGGRLNSCMHIFFSVLFSPFPKLTGHSLYCIKNNYYSIGYGIWVQVTCHLMNSEIYKHQFDVTLSFRNTSLWPLLLTLSF